MYATVVALFIVKAIAKAGQLMSLCHWWHPNRLAIISSGADFASS